MANTQKLSEALKTGIHFDITGEHLNVNPDDLATGAVTGSGKLGPKLDVVLMVNGNSEEKYYEAVLFVEDEEVAFSDPIYDEMNTVEDVKLTITDHAKTFFDFSEVSIQEEGFLTKDEVPLHHHTKETLSIHLIGLAISKEETNADYLGVLLSKDKCEALFQNRKNDSTYAVDMRGVDSDEVIKGIYRTEYGLKEKVADLLEVLNELDYAGTLNYDQIIVLEDKRDKLRKALQAELGMKQQSEAAIR